MDTLITIAQSKGKNADIAKKGLGFTVKAVFLGDGPRGMLVGVRCACALSLGVCKIVL